jgi:hypothetical protein
MKHLPSPASAIKWGSPSLRPALSSSPSSKQLPWEQLANCSATSLQIAGAVSRLHFDQWGEGLLPGLEVPDRLQLVEPELAEQHYERVA